MYLFYGIDSYLIDREIKKIMNTENIDSNSITYYDMDEVNIKDVVEDASMQSLFDNKKIIICENAYIFTGKSNSIEHNTEIFEKYILNSNPDTTLIFKVVYDKIDDRKKIVKSIKEKGIVKEFGKNENINEIVKSMFDDFKISYTDINYLISRAGKDLNNLEHEIEKLKIYNMDTKEISKDDIYNLAHHNIELNILIK
jgi:DNA polymerase-3 subunit delta